MKRIFKYDLGFGLDSIELLEGTEILTARYQKSMFGEGVKLWAVVETCNGVKTIPHRFLTLPTGAEIGAAKYIATIETPDGEIYHVFQLP